MSVRLRDLIAAERIKLLYLRSTYIFLACAFLVAVAAAWLLMAKANVRPAYRASYPYLNNAFNADTGSLLMAIAACFGATAVTGEYSSGLIRTTFTAVPARGRVLLAKALVLAAITGIAGTAATAAVILASQVILSHGRYAALLSEPGALRAATAFTLLMPLGAVTGLALGTLLRRPVTAVVTVIAVLTLLPGVAGPAVRGLTAYGAWSVLASQPAPGTPAFAAISWPVLGGWPLIAFTLAAVLVRHRDL